MSITYIKVKGVWKYFCRAVDKQGKTVDFLLTAKRDAAAARRFFDKAMKQNETPDKVTMGKSGANMAAIDAINAGCVLAGVGLMHMIRKGKFAIDDVDATSFADQFYALAGHVSPV